MPKLKYRVTWSKDKAYYTFDLYAEDVLDALKKAHKRIKRIGLSYYAIDTITNVSGAIPF